MVRGERLVRVIGVIDLLAGRAVHAQAGRREDYAPVTAVGGSAIRAGDALTLARAYIDRLGLRELYAADLDAIRDPTAECIAHTTLIAGLAALGAPLWLDAGVSSADRARRVLDRGAARVIVGLETLQSYEALQAICSMVDRDRVAFSLDLRGGEPVTASTGLLSRDPPAVVAARAASIGVSALIVIDLARVGTGAGPDVGLITRVREATPDVVLVAGGGVRGLEDLTQLAQAGCDGVLIATALHDGRLGPAEVTAAHRLRRPLDRLGSRHGEHHRRPTR